jgi:hypothetical protein
MAEELSIKISADINELKQRMKEAEGQISGFAKQAQANNKKSENSFLDIGTAVSTALGFSMAGILSSAGNAVKQFSVDSVKYGLQAEESFQALQIQSGFTADALMTDMRKASEGVVSDLDLMQVSNRALALGFQKETIPAISEMAIALGKLQGIDAKEAINDLTTGLARGSVKILENLGIVVDIDMAYAEYAKSIGKSVDALGKQERITALLGITSEQTAAKIALLNAQEQTADDKVKQISASWANFKTTMGAGLVDIAQFFFDASAWEESFLSATMGFDQVIQTQSKDVQNATNAVNKYAQEIIDANSQIKRLLGGGTTDAQLLIEADIAKEKENQFNIDQQIAGLENIAASQRLTDIEAYKQSMSDIRTLQAEKLASQDIQKEKETALTREIENQNNLIAIQKGQIIDNKDQYANYQELVGTVATDNQDIVDNLQKQLTSLPQSNTYLKEAKEWLSKSTIDLNNQVKLSHELIQKQKELNYYKATQAYGGYSGYQAYKGVSLDSSAIDTKQLAINNLASPSSNSVANTKNSNINVNVQNMYGGDANAFAGGLKKLLGNQISV